MWLLYFVCLALVPQTHASVTEATLQTVDKTQEIVSRQVIEFSDQIDRLFVSERLVQEDPHSQLILTDSILFRENRDPLSRVRLDARIALPNMQKRLNLVLQRLAESRDDQTQADEFTNPEDDQYTASLRYFFLKNSAWNGFFESGIKLNVPPDPFLRVRLRQSYPILPWVFRWSAEGSWFLSDGFGHREAVEFDRPINKRMLFRVLNSVRWTELADEYAFTHLLGLFHSIDKNQAIRYLAYAVGSDQPVVQLVSQNLSIVYRRLLYSNFVFMEVQPILTFPRADNFTGTPLFFLRLQILFGKLDR